MRSRAETEAMRVAWALAAAIERESGNPAVLVDALWCCLAGFYVGWCLREHVPAQKAGVQMMLAAHDAAGQVERSLRRERRQEARERCL